MLVANAELLDSPNFRAYITGGITGSIGVTVYNSDDEYTLHQFYNNVQAQTYTLNNEITVRTQTGTPIVSAGGATKITLGNFYNRFEHENASFNITLKSAVAYVIDKNDELITQSSLEVVTGSDNYTTYILNFTPSADVYKIMLSVQYQANIPLAGKVLISLGEKDRNIGMSINQQSEESSLLGGIIEWIQNIFNKVTQGFDNIGKGIVNLLNSIAELPQKIWSFIEDGLKSLFVPSEEFLISYKDKFNLMLEDKFGALYEVIEMIVSFVEELDMLAEDSASVLLFPDVTINLAGTDFTFGGYRVDIVPSGMEELIEALKYVIDVLATAYFINTLRKRYDRIMEG